MRHTLLAILLACALPNAAHAQLSGELDDSFHADGIVITDVAGQPDYGYAMALQPDGKVVVVGKSSVMYYTKTGLARYMPNGELDTGFGTDGLVTTTLGGGANQASAVTLQADGRILIAASGGFGVARYMPDGTLDTTFDGDGMRVDDVIVGSERANAIAVQADGKIVLAGHACLYFGVVRYNADGSLDHGFGNAGIRITAVGAWSDPTAVAILPDGKILLGGISRDDNDQYSFAMARYTPNGSLDPYFGTGGMVTHPFGAGNAEAFAMALQPNGKIVLAGRMTQPGDPSWQMAVARYHPAGIPDGTFGDNGIVTLPMGAYSRANAVVLVPDGRILVAGTAGTSAVLAMLHPDGTPDTGFSDDGIQTADLGSYTWGHGLALQPDGRILVAGTTCTALDSTDLFVARYLSNLDVGILEFTDEGSAPLIYPNPIASTATLHFELKESTRISIRLIDAEGRMVQSFIEGAHHAAGVHQLTLPFSDAIAAGNYVLAITSPAGRVAVAVVKE